MTKYLIPVEQWDTIETGTRIRVTLTTGSSVEGVVEFAGPLNVKVDQFSIAFSTIGSIGLLSEPTADDRLRSAVQDYLDNCGPDDSNLPSAAKIIDMVRRTDNGTVLADDQWWNVQNGVTVVVTLNDGSTVRGINGGWSQDELSVGDYLEIPFQRIKTVAMVG